MLNNEKLNFLVSKFTKHRSYLRNGNKYLADKFKCSEDEIIRAKFNVKLKDSEKENNTVQYSEYRFDKLDVKYNKKKDITEFKSIQSFEPLNDLELAKLHKIDLNKYIITNYWTKLLPNGKFTSSLFVKLKVENFVEEITNNLIKEIYKLSPKKDSFIKPVNKKGLYLYELSLPDLHIGKLAHSEESGEDYDSRIAISRWNNTINDLISRVDITKIDKILLPIGNDMINIDNQLKTTTNGTPQDVDTRFNKMIISCRDMLINTINQLSKITSVDVIAVPGNHDLNVMFTMSLILEAYYKNNSFVRILHSSYPRHYYLYHKNSIMFTHGNNEKHSDLGLIFANEQSELWGMTKNRYIQLGHFHKSKKVQTIIHDEYQGCQIQIIPSLSSNDFWHASKGYNSKRSGKGFLFDKYKGIIAEYTSSIN